MLNSAASHYRIIALSPEYVRGHINRFIDIAADIPKEAWTAENYLHDLPGKWHYSIAAINNETDEIAGFIIASDKGTAIHIHKYAIHPTLRSKGIGHYLLQSFEKRVKRAAESPVISLYVDGNNTGAIKFYEQYGFQFQEQVESMRFYKKHLPLIVAIHQPNFIPWLGFFHKIAHSDRFVILDHVTNRPNDAIYTKRVTLVCNNQEYWLTVPISKVKGQEFVPINEMVITKDGFEKKHLKTIELNYKKTPFFNDFFYLFELFYNHSSLLIAERNRAVIDEVCRILQLTVPFCASSTYHLASTSTQLLIDIVKKVKGAVYLHGSYAVSNKGYQDNQLFKENSISLLPQQFRHPVYRQHNNNNEFIPGTSIADALMNVGTEQVAQYINQ